MATSNMWNSVSPMLTGLMGSPVESMYGGVTGYTPGAEPMPIYKNPPQNTPAAPAPIDEGFYNSQFYKDYQNNPANMVAGMAMTYSPYFGQQTSDDGGARDRAYEQYLASIGKPVNNPSIVDFNLFNRLSGGGTAASPGMSWAGSGMVPAPTGGAPFVNTMPQMGAGVSTQAPNVSNQANFNFSPSGIDSSGSYNTADWLSVLGGLATGGLTGAASGAGVNDAVARLQALGQAGLTDYTLSLIHI